MKKIFLTSLIASTLFISGSLAVSAQYYAPYQYANQYNNYQNQNYMYQNYQNYNQVSTNCYYTGTNPRTYYGNCQGLVQYTYPAAQYTNTYPAQYQNTQYYHPAIQQTNYSPYQTYGYYRGSWYPGYSSNNLSNLFNSITQTVSSNTNCYYQNGYQMCY